MYVQRAIWMYSLCMDINEMDKIDCDWLEKKRYFSIVKTSAAPHNSWGKTCTGKGFVENRAH